MSLTADMGDFLGRQMKALNDRVVVLENTEIIRPSTLYPDKFINRPLTFFYRDYYDGRHLFMGIPKDGLPPFDTDQMALISNWPYWDDTRICGMSGAPGSWGVSENDEYILYDLTKSYAAVWGPVFPAERSMRDITVYLFNNHEIVGYYRVDTLNWRFNDALSISVLLPAVYPIDDKVRIIILDAEGAGTTYLYPTNTDVKRSTEGDWEVFTFSLTHNERRKFARIVVRNDSTGMVWQNHIADEQWPPLPY